MNGDSGTIWTKVFDINHIDGNFNIFISSQTSGNYYGVVIYYTQNKSRNPHFEFKLQQFADLTESGVYGQCVKWFEENLKGQYTITEKEIGHY